MPYAIAKTPDSVGVTRPLKIPTKIIKGIVKAPIDFINIFKTFVKEKCLEETLYPRFT